MVVVDSVVVVDVVAEVELELGPVVVVEVGSGAVVDVLGATVPGDVGTVPRVLVGTVSPLAQADTNARTRKTALAGLFRCSNADTFDSLPVIKRPRNLA